MYKVIHSSLISDSIISLSFYINTKIDSNFAKIIVDKNVILIYNGYVIFNKIKKPFKIENDEIYVHVKPTEIKFYDNLIFKFKDIKDFEIWILNTVNLSFKVFNNPNLDI